MQLIVYTVSVIVYRSIETTQVWLHSACGVWPVVK
jgi:hypothetical protein